MTDLITEARELCEKATPGPWYWDVIDAHKCIYLESARWKVMDFARYGMNGAAPRFLVDGIMERADTLLKSIPGKEHHRGFDNYIDHPDADFIARSRTLIPELCDALEKYRWIPVTERLPEERQHENGEPIEFNVIISGAKVPTTLCFDGAEWRDFWKDGGYGPAYAVTHWMPLPTPTEESK